MTNTHDDHRGTINSGIDSLGALSLSFAFLLGQRKCFKCSNENLLFPWTVGKVSQIFTWSVDESKRIENKSKFPSNHHRTKSPL